METEVERVSFPFCILSSRIEGRKIGGTVYNDTVTLDTLNIPGQAVEAATSLSPAFLKSDGSDGLLGLAFPVCVVPFLRGRVWPLSHLYLIESTPSRPRHSPLQLPILSPKTSSLLLSLPSSLIKATRTDFTHLGILQNPLSLAPRTRSYIPMWIQAMVFGSFLARRSKLAISCLRGPQGTRPLLILVRLYVSLSSFGFKF